MDGEEMYCPTCGSPWPCAVKIGGVPQALRDLPLYAEHKPLVVRWDELMTRWRRQCPGVDIEKELSKAHNWEMDNPTKRKVNKITFLTNWMHRAQEQAVKKGAEAPQKQRKKPAVDGYRLELLRRVQSYDGCVVDGEEILSCGIRRSDGIVPWSKVPTAVLEAFALQVELLA